jgi:transcriptional regulator with XRE-family HTH domain
MIKLTETFPKRLREARGALTGREFARRCGIKAQSLSRYERIGGQLPGAELLATFARTAGVSADWLLGLTDKRTPSTSPAPVATANATAPHATATANAGTLPTDAVADLLRRVLAASSTRAADPTEQRLAALERGLAALASQLAAPR